MTDMDTTSVEEVGYLRKWVELLRLNLLGRGLRYGALWTADLLHRIIRGASPHRFTRIVDGLHVGGQHFRWGLSYLREAGVTAVINMRSEFDDARAGIAPKRYLHLPTIDNTPPSLLDLERGVDFIEQELASGGVIYIHCEAGVGRAPTMAAAYLVRQGMQPEHAWERLRRGRPFIRPTLSQIERIVELSIQAGSSNGRMPSRGQ